MRIMVGARRCARRNSRGRGVMNWRIKGVTQKVLSAVPGGVAVNDLLQRTLGGLRGFESHINGKVTADWLPLPPPIKEHRGAPPKFGPPGKGPGRFPPVPPCFLRAAGARCVT